MLLHEAHHGLQEVLGQERIVVYKKEIVALSGTYAEIVAAGKAQICFALDKCYLGIELADYIAWFYFGRVIDYDYLYIGIRERAC